MNEEKLKRYLAMDHRLLKGFLEMDLNILEEPEDDDDEEFEEEDFPLDDEEDLGSYIPSAIHFLEYFRYSNKGGFVFLANYNCT